MRSYRDARYPNAAWPEGLPAGTLFHPTFLYEAIWNSLGVLFLLWAGTRFRLQWGRLFALYLIWYSAGRIVWESIRIDPSEVFFGLRTNVWAAIAGVVPQRLVVLLPGGDVDQLEAHVAGQRAAQVGRGGGREAGAGGVGRGRVRHAAS